MNPSETPESIAIIGMAGRFPQAKNIDEFWRNLREGRESVSFFDDAQVEWLPIEHPPRLDDPRYVKARAVMEKPEWFDATFFGMTPKEAEVMDPQHRVFLECAWEALEHAGCNPDTYEGMIGVFAGASMNTYLFTNLLTNPNLVKDFGLFSSMIMNDGDFVPTRVSYKFNLRGPSVNVQTACSTSLVAVCMAAQNLLGYRCDVALAGGVSITFPAHRGQHHQEGGILSPDGHCRTFDAKAAGTVLGDGAGVVVLKRLSDALADGDNVLAVIKGTAINNDGSVKIGYTAPSADGQAEAIALAQAEAGIAPDSISYIEAHGTGTPLGDPIEIAGLTKAFGPTRKKQFCAIGSVKSNIGHLDIAAGVAGLIKTVLALQHEAIPPSLHFESPNPKIDFANSPFVVNHTLKPWPRTGAPRRAGVSSFGIGGTNAHAVLEEAPAPQPTSASRKKQLLLLSAKSAAALEAATDNLAAHLAGQGSAAAIADVAYTLQVGRKVFPYRRAVVVDDTTDALRVLRAKDAKQLITARSDAAGPKVAFLFPGQGSQSVGMAHELYATEPSFRATVDRCCDWLKPRLGLDLREVMFAPAERAEAAGKLLTETRVTQPALFVVEYALAQLWMSWGVKPTAMIGHSLGEYVAATLAGVMTLEDALTLVAERARLMQAQPAGAMIAIRLPEEQVRPLLRTDLALAAVNAPGLCVVSGPFDAVEALERELAASAIPSKRLATSHAFHSAMMEPALKPLADVLRRMKLSAPKLAWVSNVTGKWITPQQATSPEYWTTHLRQTVRFADGVAELIAGGSTVLLEVGPGSTLASLARQHTATANGAATTVATLGRAKEGASDLAAMLSALGELWVAGVVPNWRDGFYAAETRRIVPLPTYPFERKRYYIEPAPGATSGPVVATQARTAVVEGSITSEQPAAAAPANSTEAGTVATLRKLFQNLSGYDLASASADASFYELGFDSLFLTQASRAVSREFGVEVTFRQLREDFVSFATLAAHLDARSGKSAAAPTPAANSTAPASDSKPFPLSDAQREVWFASQMSLGSSLAYNESMTLRLTGALDLAALQRALNALIARHESLRIRISADGETQHIAASATADAKLSISESQPEAAWQEAQVRQPFTLAGGALFRPALLKVDAHTHLLALVVHHVIADGWSLGLMARELGALYQAELSGKPAALAQPASFSAYLARKDTAAALPAARDYWRNEFQSGAPSFDLPTDRPRKAERDYSGALALRTLAPSTAAALKALCAQRGCTAFAALLAAYSAFLHRLTGQDDLVIGVPSAGQVLDGETSLVGHFANLLAIRSQLGDAQTFGDYLVQITAKLNAAMDHSQLPFGELLQQLALPRDPSRAPLAPVVFNTTGRQTILSFGEARAEGVPAPKPFVHFDLNLHFGIAGETVVLGCYYSAELFDRATIERWLGHFETLLATAATAPDTAVTALPLLSAAERHTMLVEWNSARLDFSRTATVPDLFEAQVKRTPNAIAVVGEKDRLTYAELDQRAERVAAQLRAAGVQHDERVGLFLRRTPQLLVGILGVLKSGAGYVPLDPAYPADRLATIVGDAQVKLLLTERALVDTRPAGAMTPILVDDTAAASITTASAAAVSRPSADSLAYVIYTSGSTGKPKGVQIEHRAVVALIAWAQKEYSATELSGMFFSTSASFDVSVFEMFGPLCSGGKIIVGENILHLGTHPARGEVVTISAVPSAMTEVVRARLIPESVQTVTLAGELAAQPLIESLYALPHIRRVVDVYGPTETTVYSTGSVRQPGGKATLGRPLPVDRAYVLDRHLQPVPIGIPGELYIGGEKLARGYLNRPELTAERFIAAPFLPGERLYKTGDGVRYLADGSIEMVGRLDHQVKIRGFRVELGEIESVISKHPAVAEVVVMARADASSSLRLVGYVVANGRSPLEMRALREHVARQLPEYMAPAAFVQLDRLPLNANGKLDRKALPEPDFGAAVQDIVGPRNLTEEVLVEMWRDVLQLDKLGVHDNFFELGGHSLLATQVVTRVQESLAVEITLAQFFAAPTVAKLAAIVEQAMLEDIKSEEAASTALAKA